MLSKYGNPDLSSLILRNASSYDTIDKNCEYRDTAYTFSIVCYLLIFILCIITGFVLYKNYILEIIISSFAIITFGFNKILNVNLKIEKKFKYIAFGQSYEAIVKSLIIIILIFYLDLYANLLGILFGSITLVFYNLRKTKPHFKFKISKQILLNQLKIGIPLALTTISVGVELCIERIFIVKYFGLNNFGRYIFIIVLINSFALIVNNVLQVYSVDIYRKMSKKQSSYNHIIELPTLILCSIFPLILLLFIIVVFFVNMFSGKYNYTDYEILFSSLILIFQFIPVFITTGALSNAINGQFYVFTFRLLSIVGFSGTFIICDSLNFNLSSVNIFIFKTIFTFLFTLLIILFFYKKMFQIDVFKFFLYFIFPSLLTLLLFYMSVNSSNIVNTNSLSILFCILILSYKAIKILIKYFNYN